MDRPIDAVFRRPPRWRDRQLLVRALYGSMRQTSAGRSESVRALDDVTWSRASTRAFGTRWCTTRLAPALLARTGVDLGDESAALVVSMLGRLLAGEDKRVALDGGFPHVVEALTAPLRVRSGCRVERLEATDEGVRVRYRAGGRDGVALADAAVLAVPPTEILRLAPKLAPIERGHFESMEPRRSIVVHRFVSDEAWLLRGLAGVTFVRGELPSMRDLRILGPAPEPYSSQGFWLRISLEPEVVDAHWDHSDPALVRRVDSIFAGSPLGPLPRGPSRVERLPEIISVQGRGALARRARFEGRSERTPRLAFATEALTTPDLEGRVTAGMRAARELSERLEWGRDDSPGGR
jgi:hypothetical protein